MRLGRSTHSFHNVNKQFRIFETIPLFWEAWWAPSSLIQEFHRGHQKSWNVLYTMIFLSLEHLIQYVVHVYDSISPLSSPTLDKNWSLPLPKQLVMNGSVEACVWVIEIVKFILAFSPPQMKMTKCEWRGDIHLKTFSNMGQLLKRARAMIKDSQGHPIHSWGRLSPTHRRQYCYPKDNNGIAFPRCWQHVTLLGHSLLWFGCNLCKR